jgi:hypothetical protein
MTNELMPLTAKDMQMQVNSIQEMMSQVMKDGTHFGKVPGCGDKPALLKAGAEKLGLMFGLSALFDIQLKELPQGHREYMVSCTLKSRSGLEVGQGVGCCSTMESKYRYRGAEVKSTGRVVPKEYWENRSPETLGGKGFVAQKIDGQWMICEKGEKKENPDIADTYNTVLKMAKKRAHVDAILTTTAASDIFTQDIEEFADSVEVKQSEPVRATEQPKKDQFKSGLEFAYDIPYNESQKIKPGKTHGLKWDKESKVWRGKEVPELNMYLDMSKSADAIASSEDYDFDPNVYEGAY